MTEIPRRRLLAAAAGLPIAGAARAQPAALRGTRLVFASWGGAYQEAQRRAYCDPFAAETGARVVQDGPMNAARLRTMIEGGAPDWDVADVTLDFLYAGAKDNLFEPIDRAIVDTSRIDPKFVHEFGVGCIVWSYNLAWNTQTFPGARAPKSWADLFDLQRFPGKRCLLDNAVANFEVALLADGVAPEALYPLDIDRALRKLDSIRAQTIFWSTNSQAQQLFVDEEVGLGLILNGRAHDAAKKGAPIAIGWAQNIQSVDYLVVPRGAKQKAAAMRLIDTMTRAENQAKLANMIAYSPTNPQAFAAIEPAILPWLCTAPENARQGFVVNAEYWRDHQRAALERWTAWKLK